MFILYGYSVSAQIEYTLDDFAGIWKYSGVERIVYIFNDSDILLLDFYDYTGKIDIDKQEMYFIKREYIEKKNFKYADALTQDVSKAAMAFLWLDKGDFENLIEKNVEDWESIKWDFNMLFYFEPRSRMIIDNVNEHTYFHVDKLKQKELQILYNHCKAKHTDYIQEYLHLDVRNIIVDKSSIYDSLEVKTKMYLIKDDLITVTGEQNSFFKMEYETANGNIIKGLLKKEDVEGISVKE